MEEENVYEYENQNIEKEPKKDNTATILTISILGIIVGIGCFIWVWWLNNERDKEYAEDKVEMIGYVDVIDHTTNY